MAISAIPGPQLPTTDAPTNAARGTSALADFDEFLNLFVNQLKYQDPLNPMGGDEFLSQTAQFSSVEQLVNLNEKATGANDAMGLFGRSTAAALIGRTVRAHSVDENGAEREVSGRVVQVDYGREGTDAQLGLEDGTAVPLANVVTVLET